MNAVAGHLARALFLGTNAARACPLTVAANDEEPDPWPVDFDDDQDVDIFDLITFKPLIVNETYDARRDLYGQDSVINIFDVVAMKPYYGTSCSP